MRERKARDGKVRTAYLGLARWRLLCLPLQEREPVLDGRNKSRIRGLLALSSQLTESRFPRVSEDPRPAAKHPDKPLAEPC